MVSPGSWIVATRCSGRPLGEWITEPSWNAAGRTPDRDHLRPCFDTRRVDASGQMFLRVLASARGIPSCRRALRPVLFLAALAGLFPDAVPAQEPVAGYHLEAKWKPGGDGDWGCLTLDSQAHRLYLARVDGVQVFDTEKGVLLRKIPGLDGGRGVALSPESNRGFATSGGNNTVMVFDLTSLRVYGPPVAVGRKPDAVVYEPLTRRVFVFNDESNDASVIDVATARVVATIPLGGSPQSAVSDERGSLFVNLEDKSEVVSIDVQKCTVTHRWPLAPGTAPAGLALDTTRHRLFAGCGNGRLIVLDAFKGECLAAVPIGQGVAGCAVDPGTGLAFASCGDGSLTVVREDPAKAGAFRVVETVKTRPGARAMALDPKNQAIYLAAASFEEAPAAGSGDEPSPPRMVPDSFVLLKYVR